MKSVYRSKHKVRLKLRTAFIILHMMVLLLPLGSIVFFRLYENELVYQTELELISQGAVLAAAYKNEVRREVVHISSFGKKLDRPHDETQKYTPILPTIDLAQADLLPSRPDGIKAEKAINLYAKNAAQRLSRMVDDTQKIMLSGIKILDANGVALLANEAEGLSFLHVGEVKSSLKGDYTSVIREKSVSDTVPALASISRGTGIRVYVAFPVIEKDRLWGVIYLSRTPKNIMKHLYDNRIKLLLFVGVVIFLTVCFALFTAKKITRPMDQLIQKAKKGEQSREGALVPLKNPGTVEVEILGRSIEHMACALHDRAEYIQQFARYVSHEFKTPLTSITGATELMVEHFDDMEDKQRKKFLKNILSDAARLQKLVERLLELARADNLAPQNAQCDVVGVCLPLRERYRSAKYRVECEMPVGDEKAPYVAMAEDDVTSILMNMCDNAFAHQAKLVTLHGYVEVDYFIVKVIDDGRGISSANQDKIFTPFFTTMRDKGGTGLGLGIVRALLQSQGGEVRLESSVAKRTVFVVKLPLVKPKA